MFYASFPSGSGYVAYVGYGLRLERDSPLAGLILGVGS